MSEEVLTQEVDDDESSAPQPTAEEQLEALRRENEELKTYKQRFEDTRSAYSRIEADRDEARRTAQALEAEFERHRQAQSSLRPPKVEDWDEVLTAGDRLRGVLEEHGRYVYGTVMQELAPVVQTARAMAMAFPAVAETARESAFNKARAQFADEVGDEAAFDELVPEIRRSFAQTRDPGLTLRQFDPEAVSVLARELHRQKGGKHAVRAGNPPPGAGRVGSDVRRRGGGDSARVTSATREIAAKFGLDPNRIAKEREKEGRR